MADRTAIEWTDATWSPVTGCTRVSPGCARCYIERTPPFRMAGRRFEQVGTVETTGVLLHPDRLGQPLHWRKPRRVFVCSMADLFHEQVPDEYIREAFNVMRRCAGDVVAATGRRSPSHTFQVLTKRPERALELSRSRKLGFGLDEWRTKAPNVWLGVSIENARYTWRADVLREIPAAVRFVSAEPLLGSLVSLTRSQKLPPLLDDRNVAAPLDLSCIDWLIVGGESGPGARPMDAEWARELRDACLRVDPAPLWAEPGKPLPELRRPAFFFKQVGGPTPKSGGRLLDGREWNEMPDAPGTER